MRYLCFVKMDESQAHPPKALMEAMGEHVGAAAASGVFVDGGGLYGKADAVEFRVRAGSLTVTDGPYAEAKEVDRRLGDLRVRHRGGGPRRGREDGRAAPDPLARAGRARSRSAASPSPTRRPSGV